MRISGIDKEYTKTEAIANDAYIAVDSEAKGTGKMKVSELSNGGGSSGGYGSDEFIVNFSLDTNNNVVADKTHDEIKQCFDANGMESFKIIKGVYMGRLFNLLFAADHQTPWTFEYPIVTVINGAPTLSYAMITITNTNEVSFTAQQYTLQTVSEG